MPGVDGGPVVLLCHGIGETVEHWSAVQALFHEHGIGSLVFNYSGYGKSSGQCARGTLCEDLIARIRGIATVRWSGGACICAWIFH